MPSWDASVAEHKRRVREAIIEAAMALVEERGMANVTMSLLAERSGITRKTLYSYFPDLEHVLLARVGAEVDRYLAELTASLEQLADPLDRLAHYVAHQLAYFDSQSHRMGTARMDAAGMSAEAGAEIGRHFGRMQAVVATIVRDGVASGALRNDLDVDVVSHAVLELLGVMRSALLKGSRTVDEATEELLTLLLDGARARAGGG